MEEKSLKIYDTEKTFFSKITNTLNKLLIPGKVGLNSVLISIKRNNVLKNYENYISNEKNNDKKGMYLKKYEESYSLYLDAIDKNIIESIYKKVKNNTASEFEKNALSKYYNVIHLKDNDYNEYKYKKQKFLLELDNEAVEISGKSKVIKKFSEFYLDKMESIYKSIIKQYSVKLAENLTDSEKNEVYNKIFSILDEYIEKILPSKIEKNPSKEVYLEIADELEAYQKLDSKKLDQNDVIEKYMIVLGLSRRLFTHSLPLGIAEQCYAKLLNDARNLVVDTRIVKKKERAYELLLKLIDEFNLRVLSTKVYWNNAKERNEYREFWKKYEELEKITDKKEQNNEKEILFIKYDLEQVRSNENKYDKIIRLYKSKLVEFGILKHLPNKCATLDDGIYVQDLILVKRRREEARVRKNNG